MDEQPANPTAQAWTPTSAPTGASVSRVELILQQVDALPTLSTVATRVLSLSGSGEADVREIIRLIESDPALTVRLLSLCRRAERGLGAKITTVDRAVVMLGLNAVRSAMLSVEVCGLVGSMMEEEPAGDGQQPAFDRRELWRHSVAVACAAELIAAAHPDRVSEPGEAFVCGLLHDLGKLALDRVLPRTYARLAALSEQRHADIADLERKVIGLDHHTAGKRLAENWGLPHMLQDVMWLHGQTLATLPDLPHRAMIGIVTAADALARRLHIGWSGNTRAPADFAELCRECGLKPEAVEALQGELLERVRQRASELGLEEEEDRDVLLRAVGEANRRLGRLGLMLEDRTRRSSNESVVLDALASFQTAARKQHNLVGVMGEVVRSARGALGDGRYCLLWQARPDGPCHVFRFDADGSVADAKEITPPLGHASGADPAELVPEWARPHLTGDSDPWKTRFLSLAPGASAGPRAVLAHDREAAETALGKKAVEALSAAWAWALSSTAQHQGARKLGEQLAESNRKLTEAQTKLIDARSLARLGEMAAGAAHEMNNPLAIIHGQSQLLRSQVRDTKAHDALGKISRASEKLSELITELHEFAAPPRPVCHAVHFETLMESALDAARKRCAAGDAPITAPVQITFENPVGEAWIDGEQIGRAVTELLVNAAQSKPRSGVDIRVHVDPADDRLFITVTDDGAGMTRHALDHAFDPFFSERPAGRRTGMGLARARRLVDAHGGELDIQSVEGQGTSVRIVLGEWRATLRSNAASAAA